MQEGLSRAGGTSATPSIRVMIVHDHQILADGLRAGLEAESDIDIVASTTDLDEALTHARLRHPDVVLLTQALVRGSGLDFGQDLLAVRPQLKVVLLTDDEDHDWQAFEAAARGFHGVLDRQSGLAEAVHAVRLVDEGRSAFAAGDLTRALRLAGVRARRERSDLTDRETEILQLLAAGVSTREIADRLYLSPNTVRSHVRGILQKLDSHSRIQAITAARQRGIISRSEAPGRDTGRRPRR